MGSNHTRWRGRAARHRPAKPFTRVRIPSPPPLLNSIALTGAIGAAVARFPDTEEVTGSIPVSRTEQNPRLAGGFFACGASSPQTGRLRFDLHRQKADAVLSRSANFSRWSDMKSVRRPAVALLTTVVLVVIQAVADPTGLLALVGWSGALPQLDARVDVGAVRRLPPGASRRGLVDRTARRRPVLDAHGRSGPRRDARSGRRVPRHDLGSRHRRLGRGVCDREGCSRRAHRRGVHALVRRPHRTPEARGQGRPAACAALRGCRAARRRPVVDGRRLRARSSRCQTRSRRALRDRGDGASRRGDDPLPQVDACSGAGRLGRVARRAGRRWRRGHPPGDRRARRGRPPRRHLAPDGDLRRRRGRAVLRRLPGLDRRCDCGARGSDPLGPHGTHAAARRRRRRRGRRRGHPDHTAERRVGGRIR